MAELKRICFTLRVKTHLMDEYKRRHAAVWPEMRAALHDAGWMNYSLFLRDDGLLIGYVETPDFDAALKRMAATDVNRRWQAEMKDFFEGEPGRNADERMRSIPQVFYLP